MKRYCETCGKELKRKSHGARPEKLRDFKKRRFCDRQCSARRMKPVNHGELITPEPANTGSTLDQGEHKTALDFLIEFFNNPDHDINLRIAAAKAVLPYQSRKANSIPGKKEERSDAAKKASKGRFSAGDPPKKILPFNRKES